MKTLKEANAQLREKDYAAAINSYRNLADQYQMRHLRFSLQLALSGYYKSDSERAKTSKRISICFITAGLKGPTLGGGIATCFGTMLELCAQHPEIDVTIIYIAHPYYGRGNFEYWRDYFSQQHNTKFVHLDINQKNYGSVEMKRSHAVCEYLRKTDGLYDKVVFHDFMGIGYFTALTKRQGLALGYTDVIISAHGNTELSYFFGSKPVKTWGEQATMFMERKSIELADEVTSPSQYYADWLQRKTGRNDIRVLKNIIDAPGTSNEKFDKEFAKDKTPLFFYGRMERLKGIDIFIQAIEKLFLTGEADTVQLIFAGNKTTISGQDSEEYIKQKLGRFNAEAKFIYNLSPDEFYSLAKRSNGIVVFPTLGETSSCVVVEAALAGVSFIASALEGISELVHKDDQKKFLFTPGDVGELTDKLLFAIKNKEVGRLSFKMDEVRDTWTQLFTRNVVPASRQLAATQPLVSIIVPTCNRPDLLPFTLRSLLDQIYSNIEIIVVDDNSIEWEKNEQICREFNVSYIYLNKSHFKGAACNLASTHANGEFICFFDDDDLAYPQMIEEYMHAVTTLPSIDVISCFADYFEHSDTVETASDATIDYVSLALGNSLETNILANFFGKGTFLVRKEAFLKVGGYQVDQDIVPMVDYRFYVRASLKNLDIQILPASLYAYRKNSPKSLFYENKENTRLRFLAKSGISEEIKSVLGSSIGRSMESMIWGLSLPKYE